MKKPNIVEIDATVREGGSSESKKLREEKLIPTIVYGPKLKENLAISVPEVVVEKLLSVSEKEIIRVKLGKKTYDCSLKDVEFHPVTDRVLHMDLYALDKDTPFTFVIPIRLEGTPAGLTEGGRLYQPLRDITIKCLPEHIPAEFVVNVEKLQIGNTLKVRRVKAKNMEIITPGERTIVVIRPPKGAIVTEAEAELEDEDADEEAEGEGAEGAEDSEKTAEAEATE
jgi:large subunit ribosomal protein L25